MISYSVIISTLWLKRVLTETKNDVNWECYKYYCGGVRQWWNKSSS